MLSAELLHHYRWISQQPLAIVDVETTGRYASSSRLTEISVIRATLAEGVLEQQTSLINPQEPIPAKIVQFTGISQSMVEIAPIASEILPSFLPLLNSGILTAHNLEFDYSFLQVEFARLGLTFDRPEEQQLCTVQLSRLMLPDLPSRSLPDLVRHFQFNVGKSHRAAADTMACWLLAERLLTEVNAEDDQVLLARFARQWLPLKYAARLLGCSQTEGRSRLTGVASRFVGRGSSGTCMYRRSDVEKVFHEQQENQLSLL